MKNIYKICLVVFVIDILLYLFLFHSGVVLPGINPSLQEYNKALTSFPRDYNQKLLWILFHMPLSSLIGSINVNYLAISTIQYPLIIIGLYKLIVKLRTNKS